MNFRSLKNKIRHFRIKIIIVVASSHSLDSTINARVNFFFKENFFLIYFKYHPIAFKFLTLFPIVKLYYGFEHKKNNQPFINKYLFNIDPCNNPGDAWIYHQVLSRYNKIENKTYQKRLLNLKTTSKGKEVSYLFATGSSLVNAIEKKFENGYIIVCNTIVKDRELWNYLVPDIIVAADALYHFSDEKFAVAFRDDLKKRLAETPNTLFAFPATFEPFVLNDFKKFRDRIISIPYGDHEDASVDLINNFSLPRQGNVFNLMMLPLGTTLSNKIFLWGFDGRAPNDKDFWKNSDKHFYSIHVQELKKNHPAFFENNIPKGKESEYAEKYLGDVLEENLLNAEKKSIKIKMMHNSYTKAFQNRI